MASHHWTRTKSPGSIFFGGGSPTIVSPQILGDLLSACLSAYQTNCNDVEISIEVNPATIDRAGLSTLRQAGFNRISIGAQSFHDKELQQLGRPHSAEDICRVIQEAKDAGFTNLSIDLMYGLPGQDEATWQETLHQALKQNPDHFSIYELTLEPGTPFSNLAEKGKLRLPHEDTVLQMMEFTLSLFEDKGYSQYEISNYAKKGYSCLHNINYWQNGSYIGLGSGAVSCLSGRRIRTVRDVEQFCLLLEQGQFPWAEEEILDHEARFRETVIMGLRMTKGVSLSRLQNSYDLDPLDYYGKVLQSLLNQNLVQIEEDRLRLSKKGLPLANFVMAELV